MNKRQIKAMLREPNNWNMTITLVAIIAFAMIAWVAYVSFMTWYLNIYGLQFLG